MGFGDWLIEAGSSVVSGVGSGLTYVVGGIAEGVTQVSATVVGGVTNGLQMAGMDVHAEWAESRVDQQLNVLGHIAAPLVGGVTNGLQMMGADVHVEWAESRLDQQLAVIEPATTWIAETGAPAVWNGGAYVLAVGGAGFVARGAEWALDKAFDVDLPDYLGGGLADRNRKAMDWAEDMGTYIHDNPGRAAALAGQGITNGFSSTVGFVGDIGRNIVFEYTLRPLCVGVYNLGMKDEDDANLLSDSTLFQWTTDLNDTLQIKKLFDEGSYFENKAAETAFGRIQPVINDENGKEIPNPYMSQEMTLLYGPQAVAETLAFWAVGAVTAGVGGAALASLRATSLGTKVVQVMKSIDMLADAAKLIDKAAKAGQKLVLAEEKLLVLRNTSGSARQIARAENAVQKAQSALLRAEGIAEAAAATHATEAGRVLTTAEESLEALKTAGTASVDDIARAELAVQQAKNAETAAQELIQHTANLTDKTAIAAREEAIRQTAQTQATQATQTLSAAESKLAELQSVSTTTATDLVGAHTAVEQAQRATLAAEELLKIATTRAAQTLEQATKSSATVSITQIEQTVTRGEKISNGWDIGLYKAGGRWLNPFFDTTARVTELGGAGLAFGMGVHAERKNTEAELGTIDTMREANTGTTMGRYDDNRNDYSVEDLRETLRQMRESQQLPLSESFNIPQSNGMNNATSPYASDGNSGLTSTEFNNRVDGTTVTLDSSKPTIFTLTFDTPEEAQAASDTLGTNK